MTWVTPSASAAEHHRAVRDRLVAGHPQRAAQRRTGDAIQSWIGAALIRPACEHRVQRGQQAPVLVRGADGDAQALGQAVAAHRPQHDAALDQRRPRSPRCRPEIHQQEIGLRGRTRRPRARKCTRPVARCPALRSQDARRCASSPSAASHAASAGPLTLKLSRTRSSTATRPGAATGSPRAVRPGRTPWRRCGSPHVREPRQQRQRRCPAPDRHRRISA